MPAAKRPSKSPWKSRSELLKDIASFVGRNGGYFRQVAPRMSDLFEMSVYNDAVRYYRRNSFNLSIKNLGASGTFRYKLAPNGLADNFSYFHVEKEIGRGGSRRIMSYEIHHNIKVQSAHELHIYYTADVTVTVADGVSTQKIAGGKRHSFIDAGKLITFFEVKNMNPFPEVMFSFSGLVLELFPALIAGTLKPGGNTHLLPMLVFSGRGSDHSARVAASLMNRYGFNIVSGLYANKGQIYSLKTLNQYDG
jgi:hypothetical protein